MATATFAAGCFWGVEAAFRGTGGVLDVVSGYTGGRAPHPSYERVCAGDTEHAEAVRIEYDPEVVRYDDLLDVFWSIHDPTTLNRQGPDRGTQYRSVIFYHDEDQRSTAEASKKSQEERGRYSSPIVTFVEAAPEFYAAEEYHQRYFEKRGIGSHR